MNMDINNNNLLIIFNNLLIYFAFKIACNNPNIIDSSHVYNVVVFYYLLMTCIVNGFGIYLLTTNLESNIIIQIQNTMLFLIFINTIDFLMGVFIHKNTKISEFNIKTNLDHQNNLEDNEEEEEDEEEENGEDEDEDEDEVEDEDVDEDEDEDEENGEDEEDDGEYMENNQENNTVSEVIPIEYDQNQQVDNISPFTKNSQNDFDEKKLSDQCINEIRALLLDTDERTIRLLVRTINKHINA